MSEASLAEVASILREILKWTKFSGAKEVKNVLRTALDTDQKILTYHFSDGNQGSIEIAKKVGISHTTVVNYWAAWARQGIVEPIKVRGGDRYKKSFELEDFGFEIPPLKASEKPSEPNLPTEAKQEENK